MAKEKNATRFPQGVFSLEQIEEQYTGQWVLVEEAVWNKSGHPIAGRIVAYSREKKTVVETGVQYGKKHPDVQLFLFYAGEKIPEGVVVLLGALGAKATAFLGVEGVIVQALEVLVVPFSPQLRIDGVLGVNFLERFRSTFDFDTAMLILRARSV